MRGPYASTGRWSGQESARRIARWWHSQHDRSSAPTPVGTHVPSGGRDCQSHVGNAPSFRQDAALQQVKSWANSRPAASWMDFKPTVVRQR
jgi:hypothetical protein